MPTLTRTKRFRSSGVEGRGGVTYWAATLALSTALQEVFQNDFCKTGDGQVDRFNVCQISDDGYAHCMAKRNPKKDTAIYMLQHAHVQLNLES